MNRKRSNKAEIEHASAERTAPPGEGWTAVGPGGDPHRPASPTPPGKTQRTEGAGPGRRSGTADDLGTSGSRGSTGARDEYDSNALPGNGSGSRRGEHGRGQDTMMSPPEKDPQETAAGAGERPAESKAAAARRTRGGTAYQHSLSAKGIKSSGRARSQTDEDLMASLKRLETASHRPILEDDEEGRGRSRAFGRDGGRGEKSRAPRSSMERRVRGPRFEF